MVDDIGVQQLQVIYIWLKAEGTAVRNGWICVQFDPRNVFFQKVGKYLHFPWQTKCPGSHKTVFSGTFSATNKSRRLNKNTKSIRFMKLAGHPALCGCGISKGCVRIWSNPEGVVITGVPKSRPKVLFKIESLKSPIHSSKYRVLKGTR